MVQDITDPVGSAVLPIQGVLGIISVAASTLYQQLVSTFQMMTGDSLSMMSVMLSMQFCFMFCLIS
jgi:hypothetical protein